MAVRTLGLTQGPVQDPLAASGLNQNVFSALRRQTSLVEVLDISLHGWRRWWNAASQWSPDRDRWRERFDQNLWSFAQLSQMAGKEISRRAGRFDVVLQLKTLYAPGYPAGQWPYAILVDNTYALSDRHYRPWAPLMPAERDRWLGLERSTYHRALAVFARTEWVRRSLVDDYGLPEDRAIWVGTGCNFDPRTLPKNKEQDDGQTILFVGKEFNRKGVPALLKAFTTVRQQMPEARLVLVGRELAVQQPGVEVLGKVTDRDYLGRLYAQASLFVLPARFEPCGNVVIEAMAYRLPCIVTTGGGIADLVADRETGLVIPPERPDILADCILDLLGDPIKRQRMGEAGARRVAEDFNWDRVVERMLPFLEGSSPIRGSAS
jgi:glycosyltransferase involved in cell wall biosynthesis